MITPLCGGAAEPLHADHTKINRAESFTVALPLADAFTFFEPIGEKRWAEGWNPIFATPSDAILHDGSVFTVKGEHPHGGSMTSVWTVSRYEPSRVIEYRNVLVGLRATLIRVECAASGETETRVTVRYSYTGLSSEGDELINQITPAHYQTMIAHWSEAIAAYLKRGTPASL